MYSREDWQSFVYEDCITFQNKLVVSKLKPWLYFKYKHKFVNFYANYYYDHPVSVKKTMFYFMVLSCGFNFQSIGEGGCASRGFI